MGPLVLTDAALKKIVTNILQAASGAVAGALDGVFVGLVAAPVTPARQRVLADVTEPTYSGYARQAITWGNPKLLSDGGWGAVATTVLTWSIGGGDPPLLLYGYGLFSASTTGTLLGLALFDAPYSLSTPDAAAALVHEVELAVANTWGRAALLG